MKRADAYIFGGLGASCAERLKPPKVTKGSPCAPAVWKMLGALGNNWSEKFETFTMPKTTFIYRVYVRAIFM
ncbi:MAG: hypothetical protein PHE79_05175 [Eubacteriales bacterium]|nr:hypothetical protein [Eubacteriales bacterium]